VTGVQTCALPISVQAYVENADGSHALPITDFATRTLVATAVTVSG
jgi:hypothetical protein